MHVFRDIIMNHTQTFSSEFLLENKKDVLGGCANSCLEEVRQPLETERTSGNTVTTVTHTQRSSEADRQ